MRVVFVPVLVVLSLLLDSDLAGVIGKLKAQEVRRGLGTTVFMRASISCCNEISA